MVKLFINVKLIYKVVLFCQNINIININNYRVCICNLSDKSSFFGKIAHKNVGFFACQSINGCKILPGIYFYGRFTGFCRTSGGLFVHLRRHFIN